MACQLAFMKDGVLQRAQTSFLTGHQKSSDAVEGIF